LRELGALDETEAEKPRVIIANYISSPTNCIASSSFYAVCCHDECEGLLGHLERQIGAPEASTTKIATLISELSSSSVAAPRKLSTALLDRLGEIAAEHGGSVPLHGRLFAQWMHHAFPRECPYPHVSGTTNPQTPDEWLESTGGETTASTEEMKTHIDKHAAESSKASGQNAAQDGLDLPVLPWSAEEELLVVRPPQMQTSTGNSLLGSLRNVVAFASLASVAYALSQTKSSVPHCADKGSVEKFMV